MNLVIWRNIHLVTLLPSVFTSFLQRDAKSASTAGNTLRELSTSALDENELARRRRAVAAGLSKGRLRNLTVYIAHQHTKTWSTKAQTSETFLNDTRLGDQRRCRDLTTADRIFDSMSCAAALASKWVSKTARARARISRRSTEGVASHWFNNDVAPSTSSGAT